MSIEIKKLIVNATIAESGRADRYGSSEQPVLDLEAIKAEIIAECTALFNDLIDKRGDR
jgi:hypothetical protein